MHRRGASTLGSSPGSAQSIRAAAVRVPVRDKTESEGTIDRWVQNVTPITQGHSSSNVCQVTFIRWSEKMYRTYVDKSKTLQCMMLFV
jgi:hypothetical protein